MFTRSTLPRDGGIERPQAGPSPRRSDSVAGRKRKPEIPWRGKSRSSALEPPGGRCPKTSVGVARSTVHRAIQRAGAGA